MRCFVLLSLLTLLLPAQQAHNPMLPRDPGPRVRSTPLGPGVEYQVLTEGSGLVHLVTIRAGKGVRMTPWIGERVRGRIHRTRPLGEVVRAQQALLGVNTCFFAYRRRGAGILGQVAAGGRALSSPRPFVLRKNRCYLAVRHDGTFAIGASNRDTDTLLAQHPRLAHVIGGGGWLVSDGRPERYRWALGQGFGRGFLHLKAHRTAAGVSRTGECLWLATFDAAVSLDHCAAVLAGLGADRALFFDGGGSTALEIPTLPLCGTALNRYGRAEQRPIPAALLVLPGVAEG